MTAIADAPTMLDAAPALLASQLVIGFDAVICTAAFACRANFPGSGNEFTYDYGSSVASCNQLAASYDMPAVVDADVAAGTIHFDPTLGATCLAGLGYDCSTFWQTGVTGQAACEAAITGTVADGAACNTEWQCASWTSDCPPQRGTCGPD